MSPAANVTSNLAAVSVVIPSLGNAARLSESLTAAVKAVDRRGVKRDEIIVVDDSGSSEAAGTVSEILAGLDESLKGRAVRVASTEGNRGFCEAVAKGFLEASGRYVLVVQDDVVVDEGVIDPLVDVLSRSKEIFAVAPRVRASQPEEGVASTFESAIQLALVDDRILVRETGETQEELERGDLPRSVDVVPSSAFLVRKDEFLGVGGFDGLFSPFDWEDVDLALTVRRQGRTLMEVPKARAVHRRLPGGLDEAVEPDLARAVRERNRLLLRWKHLSTRAEATEHLVSLWRTVLEAGLAGDRRTLEEVCLATARLGAVADSRSKLSGGDGLVLRT
ncbi:MAG: glycosyltransferase [Planctomycetota bacterium]